MKKQNIGFFIIVAVIIILINIISSFKFFRLDLTAEKRFSLNESSIKLLTGLKDRVYVKVYLSGSMPAAYKKFQQEIKQMLDELKAYNSNLDYEFINPSENEDTKQREDFYKELSKKGLYYTQTQSDKNDATTVQFLWPGAVITYQNKEIAVNLLKSQTYVAPEVMINTSINDLEYELTSAIKKVTEKNKPLVCFIEGHGELDSFLNYDITKSLREFYNVERVTLNGQLNAIKEASAIIIDGPQTAFNEKDKFIIDQFVMNGGKVLWLLDNARAEMDSLKGFKDYVSYPLDLNLNDQLFKYGVRINPNLVMDLQAAPIALVTGRVGNQSKMDLFPWYYFPLVGGDSIHPITKNINLVKFEFANNLDTVGGKGIKKTVLLKSSPNTRVAPTPSSISVNILREPADPKLYNNSGQILALLLEGQFPSVFKNRIPDSIANSQSINFKEISKPTKMLVVADKDLIKSDVSKKGINPVGYDKSTGQIYGNKDFFLNAMSYLLDNQGLILSRNKEITLRPLIKSKIQDNKKRYQTLAFVLPIAFIGILGLILFLIRKYKYAKA